MSRLIEGDFLEHHFDRTVGFAAYALLFVSAFFGGIPGLVAVVLAYSHQRGAGAMVASHYRFQIQIFWTCVLMFCLGCIAATAALALGVTEFLKGLPTSWDHGWNVVVGWKPGPDITLTIWALGSVVAALLLFFGSWLWSMLAPLYGFIKLAGSRPIGHDDYDDYDD